MLVKRECYKARSQITALSVLEDNNFIFSTKLHGAKIFSHHDCSAEKNLSIELLGSKTTAVAFSKDSKLLAFANGNIIYIINTRNKILIQTIRTNEGEIKILSFVPKTKYLVTGTSNGRVMQYRYDGLSHLSRLCSFGKLLKERNSRVKTNYVSAFAFYKEYFAVAGYGGVISVLKMNTYINRHNITSSKVRVSALCFLDGEKLISANIDGFIQIHSLRRDNYVKTIPTSLKNINRLLLMPNPQYVMVSGDDKKLLLIDIQAAKIISNSYLKFKDNVQNISLISDNNLLVVLQNREIHKVKLPTPEHLKTFLLYNELDKAYDLIEKDPMLQGTREHKRVEVMYEKFFAQAIDALINGDTKEAHKLMDMFSEIKSKKADIDSIYKAFEHYPRFKTLYLEKKCALAYAMSEKHPALKRTKQFKKMEELFKETFTFAQKQILIGREDIAKEILSVYATVSSKRTILKLVLKQNKDFIDFLKAIHEKDYLLVNKLVHKNEIFSQIPTYISLKNSIQNTIDKIRKALDLGDADRAILLVKELLRTPGIKDELQDLYKEAKLIKRLQESYKESDFKTCYEIIDSTHALHNLELSRLLETHFSKLIDRCEEAALKGDIKSIKSLLGDLIAISSRIDKVGDMLRLSFHTKIKGLMAKKSFKSAENIIYSYIDIFGQDSEIFAIMKSYERITKKRLALTQTKELNLPRDNWLQSAIIMGN